MPDIGTIVLGLGVGALVTLLGGWVGYPLLMLARRKHPVARHGTGGSPRRISVIVATRDPIDRVERRVQNILQSDYPAAFTQVIVALDAEIGGQQRAFQDALGETAQVVVGDPPGGKATALNAGVAAADGEVLIFTDTAQSFEPPAVRLLVEELECEGVGAVTGGHLFSTDAPNVVLRRFWRYEELLRHLEYRVHSLVATTGSNFAMKRSLWNPLPAGLICDDLYIPFRVAISGYRVGYKPEALVTDPRRFSVTEEYHRRMRTMTGMLQMCAWEPRVLMPGINPIWLQFVCHKLIRLATPLLLLVIGVAALTQLDVSTVRWVGVGAVVLTVIGVVLLGLPRWRKKIGREVALFVALLVAAPVEAFYHAIRGQWDVWR